MAVINAEKTEYIYDETVAVNFPRRYSGTLTKLYRKNAMGLTTFTSDTSNHSQIHFYLFQSWGLYPIVSAKRQNPRIGVRTGDVT